MCVFGTRKTKKTIQIINHPSRMQYAQFVRVIMVNVIIVTLNRDMILIERNNEIHAKLMLFIHLLHEN